MTKRTALITGANRGIGLAIATRLAELGHSVFIASRQIKDGEAAASSLRNRGFSAAAVELDLTDPKTIAAATAHLLADGRTVQVLVNNAGVLHESALLMLTDTQIAESVAVHLTGPIQFVRAFVPGMVAGGYGRIVNVSSGWGSFAEGMDGPGLYGISKATLNALTLRLSKELPKSIKVNAMCPGWVRTRMGGQGAARSPEEGAATAVWLATLPDEGPSGGFFRDRKRIAW